MMDKWGGGWQNEEKNEITKGVAGGSGNGLQDGTSMLRQ